MIKTRHKRLARLKTIAKEGMTMSENKDPKKSYAESVIEYHLRSDHQYILMKKYIYSGMRKKTIPYKDLSEPELSEIWCGDWEDGIKRRKVLVQFGTRILYEKAQKAFENYLLGN